MKLYKKKNIKVKILGLFHKKITGYPRHLRIENLVRLGEDREKLLKILNEFKTYGKIAPLLSSRSTKEKVALVLSYISNESLPKGRRLIQCLNRKYTKKYLKYA